MSQLIAGHSVVLRGLGKVEGPRFLNGNTDTKAVNLVPNTNPPFSGTRWTVANGDIPGSLFLFCAGADDGPRCLDGNTAMGAVGLAPNLNPPFTGTRWQAIQEPGGINLKCLGNLEGPRFLDGRTNNGTVGLAPGTAFPFTGTLWEVDDFGILPSEIQFDFPNITFPGGVPVGGFMHLTLRSNGSSTFTGHFHASGATEHNIGIAVAVKDLATRAYVFTNSGHVSGSLEPGSSNFDFTSDSQNNEIAANWPALALASTARSHVDVTLDLANITNAVIGLLGLATGVVGIALTVAALPAAAAT
jgi:hypothetical protein